MEHSICSVGDMSTNHRRQLRQAGIRNCADLLAACNDGCGRGAIAGATGIAVRQLHEWANVADLMRISGIDLATARLLTAAGVRDVQELAAADPNSLSPRIEALPLAGSGPSPAPASATLANWVEQARSLPATVSH